MCKEEERVDGIWCVCSVSPHLTSTERQFLSDNLKIYNNPCRQETLQETQCIVYSAKQYFILIDFLCKNGKSLTRQPTLYCNTSQECLANYTEYPDFLRCMKNWYLTEYFRGKLIDKIERPEAGQKTIGRHQLRYLMNFFASHGGCILQHFW